MELSCGSVGRECPVADYRRFISYMYLYENGRKTVNSGFVRVESRSGQCRIHVHMSGLYGPEADYEVYMLVRETDGYTGIASGNLHVRQQAGELDISTDSEHLMQTDYGLDRISGMVVLGMGEENNKIFGTRWDDEPLETECFVSRVKLSDILVRFSVHTEEQQAQVVQEQEFTENMEPDGFERMPGDPVYEFGRAEGLKSVNLRSEAVSDDLPEDLSVDLFDDAPEDGAEEELMTAMEDDEEEEFIEEPVHDTADGDGQWEAFHQEIYETNPKEAAGGSASLAAAEKTSNIYEKLLQRFPRMYPFDDDRVEFCVRLDLQDIGMLPMQCWIYGSNSFLLHGYYSYRHLILARMHGNDDGQGVYILGVPGLRQHREQYMASMFGFHSFKPISRESGDGGAFGYWYVTLQ